MSAKEKLTNDPWQCGGLQVQHDGALLYTRPKFKETMQGQSGHMWFTPSLPTFFHLLFKLDPPQQKKQLEGNEAQIKSHVNSSVSLIENVFGAQQVTFLIIIIITVDNG